MTVIELLLKRNLLAIFNERDLTKRLAILQEIWSPDGRFIDGEGIHIGHLAISKAAGDLLRRYPEFDFWAANDGDEIPSVGRIKWSFGIPGSTPAITGVDVIAVSNGRILALYKFLDAAAL